jgi:hypothetical protein
VRTGKYFLGCRKSCVCEVAVAQIMRLRIAQALGRPVVPEVYIRTARSVGRRGAGERDGGFVGRVSGVIRIAEKLEREVTEGKAKRLREKCGKSLFTNSDKSGVEIIIRAVETLRQ